MAKEKTWTTKAGQKVRICDMRDKHLINTILMLRQNGETLLSLTTLLTEAVLTISGSREHFCKEGLANFLPRVYWDLEKEAITRKLEIPNGQNHTESFTN